MYGWCLFFLVQMGYGIDRMWMKKREGRGSKLWNFGGMYTCIVIAEKIVWVSVYVYVNERQRGEKGRGEVEWKSGPTSEDNGRMEGENGSAMARKEKKDLV